MHKNFLWEIGVEEVPARFLPSAVEQLEKLSADSFTAAGLTYGDLHVYATPRRLALLVTDMEERTADVLTEQKGPALKAAYDENGQPTRALQGFCKGQGVAVEDLIQKEIKGNLYLFAVKRSAGRDALSLLPEILPTIANKLYFPKYMRWGYHSCRFVRPVHWMVCLYGEQVLDVEFADIKAGRVTRGHRLLGSDHIEIHEPSEYLEKLRANYVIADQNERRALCWQQIKQVAAELGGQVEEDEELLEEVTYILEYPTALAGCFEDKYLAMPKELIITPMREHQRYFPVYDNKGGLLPRFITVRNGDGRFLNIVAEGNEKVLRARLADAEFFYVEDLKDKMDDKVEQSSAVVFHEKLGTMRQKIERIIRLSEEIGRRLAYSDKELEQTQRAAYLAKADLGSRVVYEFPELQGIIGEYYANAAGENPIVAHAICEHYMPRFAGDELPQSKPGVAVALADKLDSICGFFALGMIPSGSQDPYALRRAASGCAQIIVKHGLALNLLDLLPFAFSLVAADISEAAKTECDSMDKALPAAVLFLYQRLENMMNERGISYDVIHAVNRIGLARADLFSAMQKATALMEYRQTPGFATLQAGFTRAANLLRNGVEKQGIVLPELDSSLFVEASERNLYAAVQAAEAEIAPLLRQGDYAAVLAAAGKLTPDIDAFFDSVMVMDKDESIRNNRLALLQALVSLTEEIGDLSKLVG